MVSMMKKKKDAEFRMRAGFVAAEAGGVLLLASGWMIAGISFIALGTYLGWRWFQFRAKNGMRF